MTCGDFRQVDLDRCRNLDCVVHTERDVAFEQVVYWMGNSNLVALN